MTDLFRRDLVVLSHLRWDYTWQRPHHLVSRLSRHFRRTWYVEEPVMRAEDGVRLRCETAGPVTRVLVDVPLAERWLTFGEPEWLDHAALVAAACGDLHAPVVWLYSPMALPIAQQLHPETLVYDVMDDLSSFKDAPPETRLRHAQALAAADIVFTGGHSIHEGVMEHGHRPSPVVCFPSGVEVGHFTRPRVRHTPSVAGYVGVIDERIDLRLIGELAAALPDWRIRMVGPVAKVDPDTLPTAPNIEYLGHRSYDELPDLMAGFDVGLMPFALNEATASISPTKTLEYLAAGLPVVSTAVRDVVRDHGELVAIADDGAAFASVCRRAVAGGLLIPDEMRRAALACAGWDSIADRMARLVGGVEIMEAPASATA